jgi:serine/threonine protein kinase
MMAEVVDDKEKEDVGNFLIAMSVLIFGAVFALIGVEVRMIWRAFQRRNALIRDLERDATMFDSELHPHMLPAEDLELGKVLGQGAQGVVRKALYQKEGVAVKIMSMTMAEDEMTREISMDTLAEVETEAKVLQRLRHPNITSYFGVSFLKGSFDVKLMVVMELCSSSLQDLVYREEPVNMCLKLKLAIDVAQGMEYMHHNNIIHRDMKLGNCLLTSNNAKTSRDHASYNPAGLKAKVADFGGSRIVGDEDEDENAINKEREMTSNVGTPVYMAPELMCEGAQTKYSKSIDVYSFGIMLWAIIAQARPYSSATFKRMGIWKLRQEIVEGTRPDSTGSNFPMVATAPWAVMRLVTACWEHEPAKRPGGFREICEALEASLGVIEESESTEWKLKRAVSARSKTDMRLYHESHNPMHDILDDADAEGAKGDQGQRLSTSLSFAHNRKISLKNAKAGVKNGTKKGTGTAKEESANEVFGFGGSNPHQAAAHPWQTKRVSMTAAKPMEVASVATHRI